MALQGSLQTMSVADLLQFLAVGRKTGLLKFRHGKVMKGIYFENGIIVGSSTNDPKEYLGQVLIHYGKIDENQLQTAMAAQRSAESTKGKAPAARKRLGQILVDQGVITEKELVKILETRTFDIIFDLFIWKAGQFEFFIEDPLPSDFTRVHVDPNRVVMEGAYRSDEMARYQALIPSERTVMELGAGWTSSIGVGKTTRQLLYFLEKRMSVAEISYNMHTAPFEVYGQLYELVQKGLARVAGELPQHQAPVELERTSQEKDPLTVARDELASGNAETALAFIQQILEGDPNNAAAQDLMQQAEKKFISEVYALIPAQGVPRIVVSGDEIASKNIGPQEGFVLSRINGEWDIQSILSICPFREADSLLMIKRLWDNGIIGFS
jgi:hypothetical protein